MIYGYKRLAAYLGVHENTAKIITKSELVYDNKYIISLVELDLNYIRTIIEKNNKKQAKSTKIRPIYVYDSDTTMLLYKYNTVNSFMKISGLSGSDVKALCLSTDKL